MLVGSTKLINVGPGKYLDMGDRLRSVHKW